MGGMNAVGPSGRRHMQPLGAKSNGEVNLFPQTHIPSNHYRARGDHWDGNGRNGTSTRPGATQPEGVRGPHRPDGLQHPFPLRTKLP
jgi:hypothetical protein